MRKLVAQQLIIVTVARPERVNDFATPFILKLMCMVVFFLATFLLNRWVNPNRSWHGFQAGAFAFKSVGRCLERGV